MTLEQYRQVYKIPAVLGVSHIYINGSSERVKNKIADHISQCQSLSDVCKLVKQVKREMENREGFTGISVETEESVEEVNWKQHNFNQRGRGNNRGNYRGNYHQTGYNF